MENIGQRRIFYFSIGVNHITARHTKHTPDEESHIGIEDGHAQTAHQDNGIDGHGHSEGGRGGGGATDVAQQLRAQE